MNTCPNCQEKFEEVKDNHYEIALTHQNPTCPYRFQAAAHSKEQLEKNIKWILRDVLPKVNG